VLRLISESLMKQLVIAERFCLIGHIVSKAFGLALLLKSSHAEVILNLQVDRPPCSGVWLGWSG